MIRFLVMIIIAFIGLTNTPVQAKQLVNHPRLRMVIHGGSELTPNVDSRVHIVPSTNLASGLTPYLYLGAAWKPLQWLDIESDMAWDFHNAEPVLAFRPSVKFGDFWSWSDVEIQIPSMSGYWFLQAQYTLSDFIELGIEGKDGAKSVMPTHGHMASGQTCCSTLTNMSLWTSHSRSGTQLLSKTEDGPWTRSYAFISSFDRRLSVQNRPCRWTRYPPALHSASNYLEIEYTHFVSHPESCYTGSLCKQSWLSLLRSPVSLPLAL